jgi:disulfide bond formation protein DsbB
MHLKPALLIALSILAAAALTIAGALVFEALGYAPCELCLTERIPYYAAIPLAGVAALFAARGHKEILGAAFAGLALIFAASAVLGGYHAGIEWGFWPGPEECSGVLERARSVEDFLVQLQSANKVVRCDASALRIFRLSLAGWNAIVSALLGTLAAFGARVAVSNGCPRRYRCLE